MPQLGAALARSVRPDSRGPHPRGLPTVGLRAQDHFLARDLRFHDVLKLPDLRDMITRPDQPVLFVILLDHQVASRVLLRRPREILEVHGGRLRIHFEVLLSARMRESSPNAGELVEGLDPFWYLLDQEAARAPLVPRSCPRRAVARADLIALVLLVGAEGVVVQLLRAAGSERRLEHAPDRGAFASRRVGYAHRIQLGVVENCLQFFGRLAPLVDMGDSAQEVQVLLQLRDPVLVAVGLRRSVGGGGRPQDDLGTLRRACLLVDGAELPRQHFGSAH